MDLMISHSLAKATPLSTHNGGSSPGVSHATRRAKASNPEVNLPGETRTSRHDEHLHETRGTSRKWGYDEGEEIEHGSVGEVWSGPVISPRMWLKYLMQMMIRRIRVFFFWQLLKHPSILLVYCAWNQSDQSI